MPITIIEGLPGAGKSVSTAKVAIELLYRNLNWYRRSGIKRKIFSNIKFNDSIVEQIIDASKTDAEGDTVSEWIGYWDDPSELVQLRDVDVIWDEVATHLDSTQWANVPLELKRWLQQHRKFGIEIFGTTQDFAMIDKSMRRMTSHLLILSKLIGSRDKSSTKPDVKHIWGVVAVRSLDPTAYDETKSKQAGGFPSFMFLSRAGVELFDTTQEIKQGKYPPLNHVDRECIETNCGFHRVIHA